jgi:hydrogenase nickel incorporation protein HypA/HybF
VHEAGLALRVIEIAAERLAAVAHGPPRAVRVRVGLLAGVNPDALEFAFDCLARGTELATARLVVERVPVRARCDACGFTADVRDLVFRCARCGSERTVIVAGRELEVSGIETDDPEEAPCTTST